MGKGKPELSQLKLNTLILNEKQVIREIVQGKREVPDYYYTQLLIKKLCSFFIQEGIVDVVDEVANTLKTLGYEFSLKALQHEVKNTIQTDKGYGLMDLKEPIKIYQSEIEIINQLDKEQTQRIAFSILLLTKIKNAKAKPEKRNNCTYYIPCAYLQYAGVAHNAKTQALHELYKAGIVDVPLRSYGFYCPIVATEGTVVYEITDGFESSKQHFEKVFDTDTNKVILEIETNIDEHYIHYGYDKIGENRKQREKPIKGLRLYFIKECTVFQRLTMYGSYWVELPKQIAQDEEAVKLVIDKTRQVAKTYRKQTKAIGVEAINTEFKQFIQDLILSLG